MGKRWGEALNPGIWLWCAGRGGTRGRFVGDVGVDVDVDVDVDVM